MANKIIDKLKYFKTFNLLYLIVSSFTIDGKLVKIAANGKSIGEVQVKCGNFFNYLFLLHFSNTMLAEVVIRNLFCDLTQLDYCLAKYYFAFLYSLLKYPL